MRRPTAIFTSVIALVGGVTLAEAEAGPSAAAGSTRISPSAAPATGPVVSVFPVPGGRFASPQTQITFRGIPIGQVGAIDVFGSTTGLHAGRFAADSDGRGGSFIPVRPFAPLETVTVQTQLNIRGGQRGTFSFRVADVAPAIARGVPTGGHGAPHGFLSFHSVPGLHPAAVRVTRDTGVSTGDIFVAPQMGPLSDGPMILDAHGNLVYYRSLPLGISADDFRVQTYRGKPVLTWWQGYQLGGRVKGAQVGVGRGVDEIADTSYHVIATVRAGNGLSADLHEFQLTSRDTALIIAYYPVYVDARSVHGRPHAYVLDPVVQEIDIPTGLVLFQWDSLDHLPLTESLLRPPANPLSPYDPVHLNSAEFDSQGYVIASARDTSAAYKIDHYTGRIIWRLGGKRSSFSMPASARFAFQHTVRVAGTDDRDVTIFDDGAGPPVVHHSSRGLQLRLDLHRHTARVVRTFTHTPSLLAYFEGSMQRLADGHTFIGWGGMPYFSEYDAHGRPTFDAHFATANTSYRAYRLPWHATPPGGPAAVVTRRRGGLTIYVSWNGATEVDRWAVLSGPTPDTQTFAAVANHTGFETTIRVPSARYVSVEAVDAVGNVLGVSPTTTVR